MKFNPITFWLFASLMSACCVLAKENDDTTQSHKAVCVPSVDGQSWECGTRSAPPPERGLPPTTQTYADPPPVFLTAPESLSNGDLNSSTTSETTQTDDFSNPTQTTPETQTESITPIEKNEISSQKDHQPADASPDAALTTLNGKDFLTLPGHGYTLQLTRGSTAREVISAARAMRQISSAQLYLLEIKIFGKSWWLLMHAHYATQAEAQKARIQFSGYPQFAEASIRRIGPIQKEIRLLNNIH
jgi:septal ring-binding cell division protein DamX